MLERIKKKSDRMAQKMAAVQSKIFLTLFYFTMVPTAYIYMRLTGQILHRETGYFQSYSASNRLEDQLKQY